MSITITYHLELQDISTAPTDGTRILATVWVFGLPGAHAFATVFHKDGVWYLNDTDFVARPLMWAPKEKAL